VRALVFRVNVAASAKFYCAFVGHIQDPAWAAICGPRHLLSKSGMYKSPGRAALIMDAPYWPPLLACALSAPHEAPPVCLTPLSQAGALRRLHHCQPLALVPAASYVAVVLFCEHRVDFIEAAGEPAEASWDRVLPQCRRLLHRAAALIASGLACTSGARPPDSLILIPAVGLDVDRAGSGRLIALENAYMRLHTANAYVSTIGGGAFLCRYIGDAIQQARKQIAIARALGNLGMEARCHVHLAYCDVQIGRFRCAARRLRLLRAVARVTEDDTLDAMCVAGLRHCRATHALYARGELRMRSEGSGDGAGVSLQHARSHSHGYGQHRCSDAGQEGRGGGWVRHLPEPVAGGSGSSNGTPHGSVAGSSAAAECAAPRAEPLAAADSAAAQALPLGSLVAEAAGCAPRSVDRSDSPAVASSDDGACGCEGAASAIAGSSGLPASDAAPCTLAAACRRGADDAMAAAGGHVRRYAASAASASTAPNRAAVASPGSDAPTRVTAGSTSLSPYSAGAAVAGTPVPAPLVGPSSGAAVVITAEEAGVDEFYRLRLAQPSALKPRLRENLGPSLPERG